MSHDPYTATIMHELKRTVRFCVNPEPWEQSAQRPRHNTFAAWPPMIGLGRYYEIDLHCSGTPGNVTGYIVNASDVDAAVRQRVLPLIARQAHTDATIDPGSMLPELLTAVRAGAAFEVRQITWRLTPYHTLAMDHTNPNELRLSAEFDFAASHRLDCASRTPEENRQLFGKCNNPNGHGHNYRVRPTMAVTLDQHDRPGLADLERIVHAEVLERFDHKHLNQDVPEFANVNPSVEHITRICFDLLARPIREAGGRLVEVTVWETDKTSCTYAAPAV